MKKEHLKELKQGFSWKVCRKRGFTMKLWESGSGRNLFSLWPTFSLDPVVQEPKAASTSFSPTTRNNKQQLESPFHCHMLRLCAVASLWWLVTGNWFYLKAQFCNNMFGRCCLSQGYFVPTLCIRLHLQGNPCLAGFISEQLLLRKPCHVRGHLTLAVVAHSSERTYLGHILGIYSLYLRSSETSHRNSGNYSIHSMKAVY